MGNNKRVGMNMHYKNAMVQRRFIGIKLWSAIFLVSLLFAFGCRQRGNNGGQEQNPATQEEITITVSGDEGVTVVTSNTFKVKKGSEWKNIKSKAEGKATAKQGKQIQEWKLKNAQGKVLEDTDKFNANETVYATSEVLKVSLILNLDGGETTTVLENGENGNKLLKGIPGENVIVATPTKETHIFDKWEPSLPQTFPQTDDNTVYVAKWKEKIRVTVKVDDRLEIEGTPDIYLEPPTSGSTKTFADIENSVRSKAKLKTNWKAEFYDIYDFRVNDENGQKITSATQITSNITIYIRSNYTKFTWGGTNNTDITGHGAEEPKGRIIIPENTTAVDTEALANCREVTAVDLKECANLTYLDLNNTGIKDIDVSKCTKLTYLDLGSTAIKSIDVSKCTELSELSLGYTGITSLDVSKCTKLTALLLENVAVTTIDLSKCTALERLNLSGTKVTSVDVLQCNVLGYLNLKGTGIKTIDLSNATKLYEVVFENCTNLESVDLSSCPLLKKINKDCFKNCSKAKVKLGRNINAVEKNAFGEDSTNWCAEVSVPTEPIKKLVKDSEYPEDRIKTYS